MRDDEPTVGRHPGSGWTSVAHGIHVPTESAAHLATRLRAWQLALPPGSAFTGLTSALLRGWWVPPLPSDLPVFVAAGPTGRISRQGARVCRHDVVPPWDVVDGVRLATAAETLLACARDLGLLDVVVLADAALHAGDVIVVDLRRAASRGRRGGPLLRRAIPLTDGRAESIWEGMLSVLHRVCDVDVEPQRVVVDADGTFVARGDLGLVGHRMLHEYDGGEHVKRPRQRKDLSRVRRLGHADYGRRGYTREDVLFQGVGILRDADATLGREHRPERIEAWHDLLRDSLFTPSGTGRFRRRLGLGTPPRAGVSTPAARKRG